MKSNSIALFALIAAIYVSMVGSSHGGEIPWKNLRSLTQKIETAEAVEAQSDAASAYISDVWKYRHHKISLKVLLLDKTGKLIDWSSSAFNAETVSSVVIIPQNTDGHLRPFCFVPLNKSVVYLFVRDW